MVILGPCQAAGLPSNRCLRATLFGGVVGTLQSRQGPSHQAGPEMNRPAAKALRSTKRCPLRAAERNDGARRVLRGLARAPARARGDGQMRPRTGGAGLRARHRKAARARRARRPQSVLAVAATRWNHALQPVFGDGALRRRRGYGRASIVQEELEISRRDSDSPQIRRGRGPTMPRELRWSATFSGNPFLTAATPL